MAGDNDCDKELLQWWQWWWASVHIVPCKFLMQGRKRDDEACFLGNTYAGSRDTLALGWGTTQAVFIPGVGSIRWLSISSWSPISCSFVMSFRNLTFLNQIIGTPTYIRSHPALELRRRCWSPADSSDQCKVHSCHGTAEEEVSRQLFEMCAKMRANILMKTGKGRYRDRGEVVESLRTCSVLAMRSNKQTHVRFGCGKCLKINSLGRKS